jgi:hypothetical protein
MLVLRVEIVTVALVLLPDAAAAGGALDAGGLDEGDELPHAARTAAAPASTGAAHQRLRIVNSPIFAA